ncbi:unnamed protein product [Linum tenue]|uniref:SNARE associated Golgi protein n=1 Tax=Linum tenue TaxID=586396 RepID=A0AAV0H871_9ROSI|nr:unnamed protein product [Linum tenue]
MGRRWTVGVLIVLLGIVIGNKQFGSRFGWDKDAAFHLLAQWSDRLGIWAMPLYVAVHTLTLALCLPYAVFFEAAASLLFGFFPALLCVFSAKILGASLSFWIGRWLEICPSGTLLTCSLLHDKLCSGCHWSWLLGGLSAPYSGWLPAYDSAEYIHWQPCWCCCCFCIWFSEI